MSDLRDFIIQFLSQFAGGPGPAENNLVRFGLAAVFWGVLLIVAWSRQRNERLPRERLLVWGFGLALLRELFMLTHQTWQIVSGSGHDPSCNVLKPLEHALALASVVVISGAYLRYILDDTRLTRHYFHVGLGLAGLGYLATFLWWPRQLAANPETRFHESWAAWLLHLLASAMIATALFILARKRGWLRNAVVVALTMFFLGELLVLTNLVMQRSHSQVLCPVANSLYIWAIPVFGYVYFHEQSIEKKQAEGEIKVYRDHLQQLVYERTEELASANERLQSEILERVRVEEEIAQRNAELAAQNAIAATISRSLDLDTILNAALETAPKVLGMASGCVFLFGPDDETLVPYAYRGTTPNREWVPDEREQCLFKEMSQQVVADLTPIVSRVADQPERCQDLSAAKDGIELMVSMPLVSYGRAVGALTLGAQRVDPITPQEMELLMAIGQQIGIAVENARLYERMKRWVTGLTLLHESSVCLSATLDPAEIYEQITRQSARLIASPIACLFLWDEEQCEAVCVACCGLDYPRAQDVRWLRDESPVLSLLTARNEPILVSDAQDDGAIPPIMSEIFNPKALLYQPIWSAGRSLGFLVMMDPYQTRQWLDDELGLLKSFIDRAAVALENAGLHKQVQRAAALDERQRIAAEMHDGLAQTLSYVGLKIDHAAQLLEDGDGSQVRDELLLVQKALDQAVADVRYSISSLQTDPRPRRSLQEALSRIIDAFAEDGEPPVQVLTSLEEPLFLPVGEMEQTTRVVQEALLNIRRHAQAQHIVVSFERLEDAVKVVVEDDGRGFEPALDRATDGTRFGLSIMRARAARIKGHLEIDSKPDKGTRVVLTWPVDGQPSQRGA